MMPWSGVRQASLAEICTNGAHSAISNRAIKFLVEMVVVDLHSHSFCLLCICRHFPGARAGKFYTHNYARACQSTHWNHPARHNWQRIYVQWLNNSEFIVLVVCG